MGNKHNQNGLTIIELLIAIALLGVMLVGMAGVMTPVFQSTRSTRTTMATSTQARDILENVRTQWINGSTGANIQSATIHYNNNCAKLTLPTGVITTITAKLITPGAGGNADTIAPLTFNQVAANGLCPTTGTTPAAGTLKRVTVTIRQVANGPILSELSIDMPQP